MPRTVTIPRTAVVPYGHPSVDSIYINETEYEFTSLHVIKKLNQMGSFEATLLDIRTEDQVDVKQGNVVKIFIDDNLLLKGKIETVEYSSENECVIKGYDMSLELLHQDVGTTRRDHTAGVATNVIIGYLLSNIYDGNAPWIMNKGDMETVTETAYARFEMTNRLKCLDELRKHTNSEWWVSNGASGNHSFPFNTDYFNFKTLKGSTTSLYTFYLSGTDQNATLCKRERDIENVINSVQVLGYGDGVNQISASAYNSASQTSYGLKQNTYVDRTLVSTTAAQSIADDIITNQKDPIERITIELEDVYDFVDRQTMVMSIDIGDTVTIVDTDTDLNANYKIQGIEYSNDMSYGPKMILECSQKTLTMLDELQDTRRNTEIIDVYMQGSTNCYMTGETDNCDATHGLRIDFFVPDEAVNVNRIKLNYKISKYRVWQNAAASGGGETPTSSSENAHTHTVTIPNHTHTTPNHSHTSKVYEMDNTYTTSPLLLATQGFAGPPTNNNFFVNGVAPDFGDEMDSVATTSSGGGSTSGDGGGTTPTSSAGSTHNHTVTVSAHTHDITFGIAEDAAAWGVTDITINVDGTDKTATIETAKGSALTVSQDGTENGSHMELSTYLSGTVAGAWHYVIITPNGNCRLMADLFVQIFIASKST